MKLLLRSALAFLVAASFVGCKAEAAGWYRVEGGSWTPDARTRQIAEEALRPYVVVQAKASGLVLKEWESYRFQYQGQEAKGTKFIFVNAFCHAGKWPLEKEWVRVFDGGTCFFQLKFDPEQGRYFELTFNGEA